MSATLLNKPKNGDPAALEQRLRRHQVWIYNIAERSALDSDRTWLYYSDMYDPIAIALVHAAHRVEARLEEALAGVGLSIAKFEPLSILVSRLEADGLVKRADDPADRRAVRAGVTALGRKRHAAGAKVVHAVLQEVG